MRFASVACGIALLIPGAPLAAQGSASGGTASGGGGGIEAYDMSAGLRFGTLGIGIEVAKLLNDNFAVRLGGNYFSLNRTQTSSDLTFAGTLKLQAFTALLDWFTSAGGAFHLTAGLMSNPLTLDGNALPNQTGNISINHVSYTPAQVGTMPVSVKWPGALPYIGLGFGTPSAKKGGFSVLFDLGAAIGTPKIGLSATGNGPNLAANIAAQRDSMQTSANKVPVWPVISLGVAYRF